MTKRTRSMLESLLATAFLFGTFWGFNSLQMYLYDVIGAWAFPIMIIVILSAPILLALIVIGVDRINDKIKDKKEMP